MKNLNGKHGSIILCLCELIVGILLLINPDGFTSAIIICLGILLCLAGVVSVISYFCMTPIMAAASQKLTKGLLSLILGLFCMFKSRWFVTTFPILTMLYGIVILIVGISKLQRVTDMLRLKCRGWSWSALGAVCTILFAVLIIMNPFRSTAFLWKFVGITLIVEAILDILSLIFWKNAEDIIIN